MHSQEPHEFSEEDFASQTAPDLGPLARYPYHKPLGSLAIIYLGISLLCIYHWRYDFWGPLATSHYNVFVLGRWWSVITSLFIHADLSHVLANTPMLVVFGHYLHGYFGIKIFPGACCPHAFLLKNLPTGGRVFLSI